MARLFSSDFHVFSLVEMNASKARLLPRREPSGLALLSDEEWAQIDHHVTTCDYPETSATWCKLGA